MAQPRARRGRNGRQEVGAAWEKTGVHGPFLSLELDASAAVGDAIAALLRGEDRVSYLVFPADKRPGGPDNQPDRRVIRPLRRSSGDPFGGELEG